MASKTFLDGRLYEVTGNRKIFFRGRIFQETLPITGTLAVTDANDTVAASGTAAAAIDNVRVSEMIFLMDWMPPGMGP